MIYEIWRYIELLRVIILVESFVLFITVQSDNNKTLNIRENIKFNELIKVL